jgi:RNA polymerase sigma-70 factor (ECF subfamily)
LKYDDTAFISGLSSRDPTARDVWFSRLYEQYKNDVYNYLRLKLPQSEIADVMQETFIAVWRGIGSFGGKARLKTWIIGIARHKTADRYRKMGKNTNLEENMEQSAGFQDTATYLDLYQAIGKLNDNDRELLHLVYNLELTYPEAAEVLDIPAGTVKSRMSRIRGGLKQALSYSGVLT